MPTAPIFGAPEPQVRYTERRAAYVVIVGDDDKVAMVAGRQKYFLPGGGALPHETPEETVVREVNEELARGVRLTRRLGEATQYFYAAADERHYKMHATFFAGEFTDEARGDTGEHELLWLSVSEVEQACFHACHAWAVRQVCRKDYG
jgi:8-oxo-dGTP pyrophosphatase MutT (NUDIX family)